MEKEEDFIRRLEKLKKETDDLFEKVNLHSEEEKRVVSVLHDAPLILNRIEDDFNKFTSFNEIDWYCLVVATIFQLMRIYCLPKYEEKVSDRDRIKHDDQDIKEKLKNKAEIYVDEKKNREKWEVKGGKYPTWEEIVWGNKGVGYDKIKGSSKKGFNISMHGKLHRVKTLGHDPFLGWIFGTANIMTNTITVATEYKNGEKKYRIPFKGIKSFMVSKGCWQEPISTLGVFRHAFESYKEDKHRLPAAIFAHGNHLYSDKYTKTGLPIPFLSLIDADKAYEIYSKGFDYIDLKYYSQFVVRDFTSASISILINKMISYIHLLYFNPEKDFDIKLYAVKTHKIVLYSNVMATGSNVLKAMINKHLGSCDAVSDFDLGGFVVTLYRLLYDTNFILRVKEEFICQEWYNIINTPDSYM